jgi:hypothetical protein
MDGLWNGNYFSIAPNHVLSKVSRGGSMRTSTIGPLQAPYPRQKIGRILAMAILFEMERRHLMHKVLPWL